MHVWTVCGVVNVNMPHGSNTDLMTPAFPGSMIFLFPHSVIPSQYTRPRQPESMSSSSSSSSHPTQKVGVVGATGAVGAEMIKVCVPSYLLLLHLTLTPEARDGHSRNKPSLHWLCLYLPRYSSFCQVCPRICPRRLSPLRNLSSPTALPFCPFPP